MAEMMNILMITGQNTSQKIGGLERWYISISKQIPKETKIFLFYDQQLPSNEIIEKFKKNRIFPFVFPFASLKYKQERFKSFLEENEIGTVWAHFENTIQFLPLSKKLGCKTLWTLHMGNYYFANVEWKKSIKLWVGVLIYRMKIYLYLFFVDKILCVSNGIYKEYVGFFGHSKKFEINHLGFDKEYLLNNKFDSKKEEKYDTITISCIAFHARVKGVDIFVKAISELNKRGYKDIRYLQIGGEQYIGDYNSTLELHQLAKNLDVNNIDWLGIQQQVLPFLQKSHIYCQPSRHEALGFSIMEAMSLELPVVAANIGGIPELIENGRNGYLFQVENYVDLADKLEILIKNEKIRKKMGAASLRKINNKKFQTENNVRKIIEYLSKR